jgi:type VI secretion system ImpM family protein
VDVGLYGKLFSHGDFLRRRVSDAFVDGWDAWLQKCMAASRAALGDRWLDLYLTSPAWRFVCAANVCGPAPCAGLIVPSVDRVGRYFPLTIVCELPEDAAIVAFAFDAQDFFASAETLLLDALAQDEVDFNTFDASVARLAETLPMDRPRSGITLDRTAAAVLADKNDLGWQLPLGSVEYFAPVLTQLLSHRLSELYDPLSIWWTDGSSRVAPNCLIARGLPHVDTFTAFLDGAWSADRWRMAEAAVNVSEVTEEILPGGPLLAFRSAAASDVGRVRKINQDAFLERPEVGLWVVADGLGGHTDGDVASRMVCDALADFTPAGPLDAIVEAVQQRVLEVNDHLLRTSERSLRGAKIGSTVAVLLIRGGDCAALWAGDSRIYRLREHRLEQLTRDHSAALSASGAQVPSNVVTRAVGVSPGLALDVQRDVVRPGDRFLLCSDGLTRRVPDDDIETWMQQEDIEAVVGGLIRTTLEAGAPDNVTVLIAEATSASPD